MLPLVSFNSALTPVRISTLPRPTDCVRIERSAVSVHFNSSAVRSVRSKKRELTLLTSKLMIPKGEGACAAA